MPLCPKSFTINRRYCMKRAYEELQNADSYCDWGNVMAARHATNKAQRWIALGERLRKRSRTR